MTAQQRLTTDFTHTVGFTILVIALAVLAVVLLALAVTVATTRRRKRSPQAFYKDFNRTFEGGGAPPLMIQRRESLPAYRKNEKQKKGGT